MRLVRWLARLAALLVALFLLFLAREWLVGVRGPHPGPTAASEAAGRLLLARLLDTGGMSAWSDPDTVHFAVEVASLRSGGETLVLALDPAGRSARFTSGGSPGVLYHYEAATERVTRVDGAPLEAKPARLFATLLPSIVFWSLVPRAFDDPTARAWRLPDGPAGDARLAVRWPGEKDWFELSLDPASGTLKSLQFVDARFGVFFRWRGLYAGPKVIDGRPLPAEWRFRAAPPILHTLLGGRDLVALRWREAPAAATDR